MKILISGGCKNGKTTYAQELALNMRKAGVPLYYLATMIAADNEDKARITRHQKEREGLGFETVEAGKDIGTVADNRSPRSVWLLDSLTALLANEMFFPDGRTQPGAAKKVSADLTLFLRKAQDAVVVSDSIYSDAFLFDEMTEMYRRGLALIDRHAASLCDVVIEASGGVYIPHKGVEVLKEFSDEIRR